MKILTGTMDIEYKYRKEKLNKFGMNIFKAPLSHYETQIVYQSRYQAIAVYPLPVTTFTTKEKLLAMLEEMTK